MVSRVAMVVCVIVVSAVAVSASAAREPPSGTSMYLVRQDPRLCPSPMCGGYWVTIANGVRTRCSDGVRRPRCYVGRAVDTRRRSLGAIPEGALIRGAIDGWERTPVALDQLVVSAVYPEAGDAEVSGGYYRVFDTGIVCVRAPCFSYRAQAVNGSSKVTTSTVDLDASGATRIDVERARLRLRTKDGLYARGRFGPMPDGGRAFRALRLYLRVPLPRA
jgi:uncharacterized protein DUF6748